jgi:hypothetical protein
MRTIEKMERAFALHETIKARSDMFMNNRIEGRYGIAVSEDHNAKEWKKLQFRLHFFQCYLRGQKINWFHAGWLTNDEAARRNKEGI